MVSPIALDIPKIIAVDTPEIDAGIMTRHIVSQWVAPRAKDASFNSFGTPNMASSLMLQIVGTDIKASIMEALNKLSPTGISKVFCKKGATTTIPKKPITTDGRAAKSSTTGLKTSRARFEAISARKRADATPRGMDITEEMNVTENDAIISGKIPKSAGSAVGYQYLPNIKSITETLPNIGSPSMKRKATISARVNIEAIATIKKRERTIFSLFRLPAPL
jgi:hypothetical protein